MGAEISVVATENGGGWACAVQISDQKGQTRHSVNITRGVFQELVEDKPTTPEELVKKSFEFLLEREPKESILRQFDLPKISEYFPEYPSEIRKRI